MLSVAAILLTLPVGTAVGMLFGLLGDFGLDNTVVNIRVNAQVFADQYAGHVVGLGWTALACLLADVAIVIIWFTRRKKRKLATG